MNYIEIVKSSGETARYPARDVISVDRLGHVAELKRVGKESIFITWLLGRCERLVAQPNPEERLVVKLLSTDHSTEPMVLSCLKAELR